MRKLPNYSISFQPHKFLTFLLCCPFTHAYLSPPEIDIIDPTFRETTNILTEHSYFGTGLRFANWSDPPVCTRNAQSTEEYCVFTSKSFAGGRGISLLTFPEHVEHFTKLPAFVEPNVHSELGINQLTDPPFVIGAVKDRGIGVVANRTIKRGEWLMSFTPAYMTPADGRNDLDYNERLSLLTRAIQGLPGRIRFLTENLAVQGAYDPLEDILITNTFIFPITVNDEGLEIQYTALFPEIARFNHDCRPNAHYTFDPQTLTLHVVAFRDIFPNEELTITYIDPVQKRKSRLRALNKYWGFTCNCALCTAPSEASKMSDIRIGKIQEILEELEDTFSTPESTPSITHLSEQLISLYREERLWTLIHNPYITTATNYNGIGDALKAQKFAELALRSGFICRGHSKRPTEYSHVQALLEDPHRHDTWMDFVRNFE